MRGGGVREARGGAGMASSQSEAYSLEEVKLTTNLTALLCFLTSPTLFGTSVREHFSPAGHTSSCPPLICLGSTCHF